MTPILALTPGEPAGVGPDLALCIAAETWPAVIVAFADPELLAHRSELLGLDIDIQIIDSIPDAPAPAGSLYVHPVPLRHAASPGKLDPDNSGAVLESIRLAARGCLENRYHALVTGPVHKGVINESGLSFTGHTEFLADLCRQHADAAAPVPVMMLATDTLRVALATTHLPLSEVPKAITTELLSRIITVLRADLSAYFGLDEPRILVSGLNPHAGEDGHLGREEIDVIAPVIASLVAGSANIEGPLAADTLFTPPFLARADAVLAMYHDQGLAVLKHLGFGRAVNITLGLPIIRTSVDHGTALDLAGSGKAHNGSLKAAIRQAMSMAGYANKEEAG